MIPEATLGPGEGERWARLAEWLIDRIPVSEVDGVWVFRVVRRGQKEYGTAVISLVSNDRRRICTARYVATIKGRQRGGFETELNEVGSGPLEALHELLALVPVRADDEDPPAPVEPQRWFPRNPESEVVEPTESDRVDADIIAADPAIEHDVDVEVGG